MKRTLLFFAALFFSLLLLDGCTPSKSDESREREAVLPAERLVKRLEANRRKIKTFEGVGRMKVNSETFNNQAPFTVALKKPDSVGVTIYGPFGIELAKAFASEERFLFYDAFNNKAYQGEVNANVLEEIFKINLAFSDLLDAFIGGVNLTEVLYQPPTDYSVAYDEYVLIYDKPDLQLSSEYHVNIEDLGITYYALKDMNGATLIEGRYKKFSIIEGVAVPFEVEIANIQDDQKIRITYDEISVNEEDIIIYFDTPRDAEIIDW